MKRIDNWDEYFMRIAYLVAQKSSDPRTKIGSVLTRGKNIISTGYNGFPRQVIDSEERYNNRDLKLELVCHSEENTILTSARLGVSTLDTILYSFGIPCVRCARALIQGGVTQIVVHAQWPNLTHSIEWIKSIQLSKQILGEVNIPITVFDKVLGVQGYLDGKVINV